MTGRSGKLATTAIAAIAVLGLLVGAYIYGRFDAPDRTSAVTKSLLDGVTAYHAAHQALTREVNVLKGDLAASEKRATALARKRTPVPAPAVTPAACAPWADNLRTCDQQLNEKDKQLQAAGRIKALGDIARRADSTRIDSLTVALKAQLKRDQILGISLPSRRTSFTAGGVAGVLLCLALRQPC